MDLEDNLLFTVGFLNSGFLVSSKITPAGAQDKTRWTYRAAIDTTVGELLRLLLKLTHVALAKTV